MRHSAANVHDSRMLETLLDAVSPIRCPRGHQDRPRKRPEKLHADKGYRVLRLTARFIAMTGGVYAVGGKYNPFELTKG